MPFRARAFLICFIPFAVLMAASFWMAQKLVQSTVRDDLRASLRVNQLAMARRQLKADDQSARFLKLAAENAALKTGMRLLLLKPDNQDALKAVADRLREMGNRLGYDFLSVSSPDGSPLAGVVREAGEKKGGASQFAPLDTAQIELNDKGLLVIGNRMFQFASAPVTQGDQKLGSLAVGENFDLPSLTTSALLVRNGEVIDYNIPNVLENEVEAAVRGCMGKSECDFRLKGANWISVPLENLGEGYVLWNLENVDQATAPVRSRLRSLFFTMAIGSVLIALLFSIVSSRSIVKPIALVVSHLRNAESTGELPEFTSGISSTKEIRELAETYNRAARSVKNARDNLQIAYVEFIGTLANALDARDRYSAGHSRRVSLLSCATAAAMGLSPERIELLRLGALLHDIGKIGVADSLLQKPGRLTDEEFAMVKEHTVIGRRILEGVQGFAPYLAAVELHHENWDGSGYPKGQSGEETPIDARIIHVLDAYDAMTTDRCYRGRMPHEQAVSILQIYAGTQFDPRVVEIFLKLPLHLVTESTSYFLDDDRQLVNSVVVETR